MLACVEDVEIRRVRPPVWFWLVVAAQILVPTLVLVTAGVPSRFGFHMYSRSASVEILALDASGREVPVDPDIVTHLRLDLPLTDRLPEYVCERVPEAVTVTVSQLEESRTVTCSP